MTSVPAPVWYSPKIRPENGGEAFRAARRRANMKHLPFTLTPTWVKARLSRGCEISGLVFDTAPAQGAKRPFAPSIDRIDSSRGYTPDNCRLVLNCINVGLNTWGVDAILPAWEAAIKKQKELKK